MLHTVVYKDISEYTEKVVGKLSLRTLACLCLGGVTSVAVGAFCYFALHIDVDDASFPIMCACMPFWLAGFWRPNNMRFEEFALHWANFHLKSGQLTYASTACLDYPELTMPAMGLPRLKDRLKAKRRGAELYDPTSATHT